MLYQFVLNSKITQNINIQIYICLDLDLFDIDIGVFFFIFFSFAVYPRRLEIVPCAIYSSTSLLIHSKCNSLHLLLPNSLSIPLPPSSPLITTSLFSTSVSVSVLQIGSFVLSFFFFFAALVAYLSSPQARDPIQATAAVSGNFTCHILDSTCKGYPMVFVKTIFIS